MKHLISITMLFILSGCDGNSSDTNDTLNSTTGSADVTPDYLNKPLQGKVSQRGLYRMVRSGGVIDDNKTTTGKVISNPVIQQVKSTERIPLVKGAQMYLQYKIWSLPNRPAYVDLRRVLTHPEMTLPDGTVSTGSDFKVKRKVSSNHVIVYTGYGFDEDYELVEGEWTFQIWYQDKKLIEQKFTTYWPDEKEIAKIKPMLELGNQVQVKMQSPNNKDSKMNWPRVMAGVSQSELPPGVTEARQEMKKPIVTQ
ncbi:hypothetical protein MNBD_GAMMA05-2642 [hydrothermal vent metagenome]|uniref:DUF3859 domain-containing protein n=1 Tax=hydrothermal vent metagenome TaxID=652676 RepID=A0A3B0X499_9ZZZZ